MKDWRVSLLKTLGAPVTKGNLKLLSNWQRWEGGHTKNRATYNWLNTSIDWPNSTPINSVGVKAFPNYKAGIQATAQTLTNGRYNQLVKALRSGKPYTWDIGPSLQIWVSGRPDGNPGYAQKVLGRSGAPKGSHSQGGAGARGNLALAPDRPSLNFEGLQIAFGDDPQFLGLLKDIYKGTSSKVDLPEPQAVQAPPGAAITVPLQYKGTHVTDGLGWGTRTATDIMGSPGTPILAPAGGRVIYYHPTGAQGGGSMLIKLNNGKQVWLGHITSELKPGSRFMTGGTLALISPDHPRPHLHVDVR